MIEQKLSRLIEALVKKSKEGAVQWKATASPDVYLANLEEFGVTVESDYPSYILRILDENGTEIEAVKSKFNTFQTDTNFLLLDELFGLARRSVHNVEESLDTILRKLEA